MKTMNFARPEGLGLVYHKPSEINTNRKGITLLEIILVIAVIVVLTGGTLVMFSSFVTNTHLDDTTQKIIHALRKANTNSITRLHDLYWGVYFDDVASHFTLFASKPFDKAFEMKNALYDEVTNLPTSVKFSQISLNGGGREIIFRKIAGDTAMHGLLKLRSENGRERTIIINQFGQISEGF